MKYLQNAGMKKSIHTPEYAFVLKKLVKMRKEANLTNRQLAKKLNRENSFVWRIEHGERRLDIVEFFWVCEALGQKPDIIYSELVSLFKQQNKSSSD